MDLIDEPDTGANAPEFTVSEISGAVKRIIEGEFGNVRVRGEIGRISRPSSGHIYLDLKDDRSVLASVIWRGAAMRMDVKPEEGLEVIATGRLTTFGVQSKYQMEIQSLRPAGMGALMAMLEKRRRALEAEGLFATARKKRLPYLPEVIGVVTSPSGAVIRDILHRLRDRFPRHVLLWPVVVQGDRCAAEVSAAIRGFNAIEPGGPVPRPDVLILARGGGSVEDLWGFNEEIVVRAVAESRIPIISAVGHETDTTLADYAADVRAPTPTAAAELAVPVRSELQAGLAQLEARRGLTMATALERRVQRLSDLARALPRPQALLADRAQRLDAVSYRLPAALGAFAARCRQRFTQASGRHSPGLLTERLGRRQDRLAELSLRLPQSLARSLHEKSQETRRAAARLLPERLAERKDLARSRLAPLPLRLERTWREMLTKERERLAALERLRLSFGPDAVLARGYAIVRDAAGNVLPDKSSAERGQGLQLQFRDGMLTLGHKSKRKPKPDDKQASLF